MGKCKGFLAALLLGCLLVMTSLGALAATDVSQSELDAAARLAATYMAQAVPEPGMGNELALLAIVRSPFIEDSGAATESYQLALSVHLAGGVAETQALRDCAWQALALAACGADVADTAPVLLERLPAEALAAAGPETQRLALLLFGPAQVSPAGAIDLPQLATRLAGTTLSDGSFPAEENLNSFLATCQSVVALAPFVEEETVQAAIEAALAWLEQQQTAFGGFDDEEGASAQHTAAAALALATIGVDGLRQDCPTPAQALLAFQYHDGSFLPDPDSPPDPALSALCALALAAQSRHAAGDVPVFHFTGVPIGQLVLPGEQAEDETPPATEFAFVSLFGMEALPLPVVIAGGTAIVGVVLILLILLVRRHRRKHPKKDAAVLQPGGEDLTALTKRKVYAKKPEDENAVRRRKNMKW